MHRAVLKKCMFNINSALADFVMLNGCSVKVRIAKGTSFVTRCLRDKSLCNVVISVVGAVPNTPIVVMIILLAVITFCTASFSSVTLATSYCDCRALRSNRRPGGNVRLV